AMDRIGGARLDRGRTYARNGSVLNLTIQRGIVSALVKGSRRSPYETNVAIRINGEKEWDTVMDALSKQAIYAAKLLAGQMPEDIERIFQSVGMSLFPVNRRDITFECSCPDWGDPCKHAAAVYYLFAEELDNDPFLLFHLRGYTRKQVLDALQQRRTETALGSDDKDEDSTQSSTPLDINIENFWTGNVQKFVDSAPSIPQHPPSLSLLGDPPGKFGYQLRKIYNTISETALDWLIREELLEIQSDNNDKC
ncbi:MAG: SWIM zinc finger family protein, partial [Anaerolineaceae bacterium]|nr:SWIM zinc finger family protein [Anaerolineaceae bacterium]